MTDRPITFRADMIRALADGRKTQTRRIMKVQPDTSLPIGGTAIVDDRWCWLNGHDGSICGTFDVPFAPGDRLWVREAFRAENRFNCRAPSAIPPGEALQFPADDPLSPWDARTRPGIHMPRWASRITLTVTDVRIERVQDISEADARAEGAFLGWCECMIPQKSGDVINRMFWQTWCHRCGPEFSNLWGDIHGPDAWAANPWVAAITFTMARGNIDAVTPDMRAAIIAAGGE